MAWTIKYSRTAIEQLLALDTPTARRLLDYGERLAGLADPRTLGQALHGPLGTFWSFRSGALALICEVQDAAKCILVLRLGKQGEI